MMANTSFSDEARAPEQIFLEAILVSSYLLQAYKCYISGFENILKQWAINPSQCMTLWFLRYYDTPLTATRIARMLGLETHSVTSLLDGLEKKNMIKRHRSTTDRRVVEVALTPTGKQTLAELRWHYQDFINAMFADRLSENDLGKLTALLQVVRDDGYTWQGIEQDKIRSFSEKFAARMKSVAEEESAQIREAFKPAQVAARKNRAENFNGPQPKGK
jgi:DNA-binding MarR family transcriptional regulator